MKRVTYWYQGQGKMQKRIKSVKLPWEYVNRVSHLQENLLLTVIDPLRIAVNDILVFAKNALRLTKRTICQKINKIRIPTVWFLPLWWSLKKYWLVDLSNSHFLFFSLFKKFSEKFVKLCFYWHFRYYTTSFSQNIFQ